ncbi:MAG: LacI family DNA-binding transcriptional regulator [Opitutaceae bacterium]|nr:LacI family DNA-binding transcriptional regulator [Opitutaceae bacterium]
MSIPTLQSIADACGTNRMTVSLALRGRAGVSEETKARVVAEAERQGYRPNPLVSALMARLRGAKTPRYQATLGLIHAADTADWRKMFPACRHFDAGLRARTGQLGYGLEVVWLRAEKWAGGGVERALKGRGIDGVVVAPLPGGTSELGFDFSGFAVAAIGQSLLTPVLHSAAPNYFRTIELGLERLVAAGRRRVGLALEPTLDERSRHQWLGAYLGCQASAGGGPRPLLRTADAKEFLAWVREERLDAVMSADTQHLEWLRAAGVAVPGRVAYVCFTRAAEMRGVAGVANNPAAIAAAAVDMVVAQLHRNERGVPAEPRVLQIAPHWEGGATV